MITKPILCLFIHKAIWRLILRYWEDRKARLVCCIWRAILDMNNVTVNVTERLRLRDWDKFIQHNLTLYRCMISDIHDSSYVLFSINLISNTSLHVGRPLLRPFLVAYAEATLARQKDSATNEKCWHHFRILIVDKWSVVRNECKSRKFLFIDWKSLWSFATWLVISDTYIGEVTLQLLINGNG